MKKFISFTVLATLLTFTSAQAESAHEHGVANLNIAISQNVLAIELDTPADNVLGFEHEPKNEKQAKQLENTISLLKQATKLFNISDSANCKLTKVDIENPFADHDEHEKHDDHDEHEGHEGHSDFEVQYRYTCENSNKLNSMDTAGLFNNFTNFTTLHVQWLNETKQSAKTLNKKDSQVNFDE